MKKNGILVLFFLLMPSFGYATLEFSSQNSKLVIDQPNGTFVMRSAGGSRDSLEGNLVITQYNNVQGNALFINNGIISDGDFSLLLTGTYDPNSTYSIIIPNGGLVKAQNDKSCPLRIQVTGTTGIMQGFAQFSSSDAVQLSDQDTVLTIDTKERLGTNILLSGGTLSLDDGLVLADNISIKGTGRINFNENNLSTGDKSLVWTDTLKFVGAENLILFNDNKLYGQWIFEGDGFVFGNNNVLDLSSGATLWIRPNTSIEISDLIIDGLRHGQIILDDQTSELHCYNVTFGMNGNCTFTGGRLHFEGPNKIVTGEHLFSIEQSASMTVDAGTVLYDPLDSIDNNNVRFGTGFQSIPKFITYLRGGSVRKADSLKVGPHKISANKKLDREFIISSLRPMIVDADPVVDGDGFAYQFARNPGQTILTVADGMLVQYKNILLKDFPIGSPGLSIGDDAQLFFGPNATIELGENAILNETLYFTENAILNGKGKILQLGDDAQLVLRPGASLLIDDITIKGLCGSKIYCMDNNCTLSLGDVTIKMTCGDYTFTQGRLDILGQCDVVGTATFDYQSTRNLLITNFGTLFLHEDVTLSYSPRIANRDLIVMDGQDATIHLDGATLMSTTTGMRLTTGTIIIDGIGTLQNNGAASMSENISFGNGTPADDLTVIVNPGATLDVITGALVYDNED